MNLGRALGSLLVTGMLALAPTAALAYDGDGDSVTVEDTNPDVGESVTVTVECEDSAAARIEVSPRGGAPADAVYIDEQQTTTSGLKSCLDGEAQFEVRIMAEGRYLVLGRNAAGEVLGRAMLVVGDGVRGGDPSRGGDRSEGLAGAAAGGLGGTGADALTTALGVGGMALLLAGGGVLVARRRASATA